MLNFDKIQIKKNEDKEWPLCPTYNGLARIVDVTEMKTYKTEYGEKEKFRFLIELNLPSVDGKNWVLATAPMTPSMHEKSALYRFAKSIGVDAGATGFTLSQLAGKYLTVIVDHVESENKKFANIIFTGKVAADASFPTTYVERTAKI